MEKKLSGPRQLWEPLPPKRSGVSSTYTPKKTGPSVSKFSKKSIVPNKSMSSKATCSLDSAHRKVDEEIAVKKMPVMIGGMNQDFNAKIRNNKTSKRVSIIGDEEEKGVVSDQDERQNVRKFTSEGMPGEMKRAVSERVTRRSRLLTGISLKRGFRASETLPPRRWVSSERDSIEETGSAPFILGPLGRAISKKASTFTNGKSQENPLSKTREVDMDQFWE